MSLEYHPFRPLRPAEQYLGQSGSELGKLALPAFVLELIAEAKMAGRRPSGVWVDGEYVRVQDGARYLSIRVDPPPDSERVPSDAWRKRMPT